MSRGRCREKPPRTRDSRSHCCRGPGPGVSRSSARVCSGARFVLSPALTPRDATQSGASVEQRQAAVRLAGRLQRPVCRIGPQMVRARGGCSAPRPRGAVSPAREAGQGPRSPPPASGPSLWRGEWGAAARDAKYQTPPPLAPGRSCCHLLSAPPPLAPTLGGERWPSWASSWWWPAATFSSRC